MAPTPYDGLNPSKGKKNAVTLVNTVVTRKSAVQPSNLFPASSPNATTTPDKIPTKLIATWTRVNVVMPKIMMRLLSEPADITTITTQIATCAIRGGRASPPLIRSTVSAVLATLKSFALHLHCSGPQKNPRRQCDFS